MVSWTGYSRSRIKNRLMAYVRCQSLAVPQVILLSGTVVETTGETKALLIPVMIMLEMPLIMPMEL